MEFPGNTFVVQGQGTTYMLYLEQNIRENFFALLKNCENLVQRNFPHLR